MVTGEVVGGVSSCSSTHELRVHRVYTQSSIMVTSTRLNGASSFLPVAPVVVVDQAGNALAVWKETTGSQPFGYGADTTRTWAGDDARFGELVEAVDREQQALCGKVRAGLDYRQLHLEAHLRLGGVLKALGIVDMEADAMLQQGVTSTFFPHGLGHPIGLQVHDVAGYSDVDGKLIPRPVGHPYLRMTRTLEPGMVVTIEPGIYFIPTLLKKLRADAKASRAVDWHKVEHLAKFGGVRIEDEVHCTDGVPENLSRDAFAEVA